MRSFLPMDITIRAEQKEDYDKIYDLIKIAFQSAKVSDGMSKILLCRCAVAKAILTNWHL